MRKLLFILFAATLLVSCSKDDDNNEPEPVDDGYKIYQEQLVGQWISVRYLPTSYAIVCQFTADSSYTEYKVVDEVKKTIKKIDEGSYVVTDYKKIKIGKSTYQFEMTNKDEFLFPPTIYHRDNTEYTVVTED